MIEHPLKPKRILILMTVSIALYVSFYLLLMDHHSRRPDLRPISPNEFTYDKLGDLICGHTTIGVDARCRNAGGVMMHPFYVMDGRDEDERYGCFPGGDTYDAGKPCTSDSMCEGLCSFRSDIIKQRSSIRTCSSFKKPLFATIEKIEWRDKGCPEE